MRVDTNCVGPSRHTNVSEDGDLVLSRVSDLKREGLCHAEVARCLKTEGFRGPSGQDFTVPMVSYLYKRVRTADGSRAPATDSVSAEQSVDSSLWRCSALSRHVRRAAGDAEHLAAPGLGTCPARW